MGCLRMVPTRAAGVVFSMDPADPQREVLLVSASLGLGVMVVEGGASVDRFSVSRAGTATMAAPDSRAAATARFREILDESGIAVQFRQRKSCDLGCDFQNRSEATYLF